MLAQLMPAAFTAFVDIIALRFYLHNLSAGRDECPGAPELLQLLWLTDLCIPMDGGTYHTFVGMRI